MRHRAMKVADEHSVVYSLVDQLNMRRQAHEYRVEHSRQREEWKQWEAWGGQTWDWSGHEAGASMEAPGPYSFEDWYEKEYLPVVKSKYK